MIFRRPACGAFASRPKVCSAEVIKPDLHALPRSRNFVESHRDSGTYPEMELIRRSAAPLSAEAASAASTPLGTLARFPNPSLETPEFAKYLQGAIVGKEAGPERQYNVDILIGVDGERRVVVDSAGRRT